VLGAAAEAGVQRLVFVSSAAVYGAWPDLPDPVPEDTPLRPLPGFAYGRTRRRWSTWLDTLEAHNPTCT
jgi:UDP-glucose 4-epimerase